MSTRTAAIGSRQPAGRALCAAFLLASLAACAGGGASRQAAGPPPTLEGKKPSGFVEMREVQVAYIGNAGGGSGTLTYQGQTYPFRIAGLGVGGIGRLDGRRRGRGLRPERTWPSFPAPTPPASTAPSSATASVGDIWLKNEHDVVLHLKAKREGLMLSVGADAIDIRHGPVAVARLTGFGREPAEGVGSGDRQATMTAGWS